MSVLAPSEETPKRTLRLALAMRGGVSLSVWIGGAVREIEALRRGVTQDQSDSVIAHVARATGCSEVEVDVLTGASAGGLNAVMFAGAMSAGASVDSLRTIWLEHASIATLLHKASTKTRLSLLRGNYFLDQVRTELEGLLEPTSPGQPVERLEVLLSVTSVVPQTVSAAPDPSSPVAEQRVDGLIRFRRGHGVNDFVPGNVEDLAVAARSTASFPVAFEPVPVESNQLEGNIEFRPRRPEPLLLFDGGVVDNMPVGKAARAIGMAPADGPTERVLLYLHPSPGVPDAEAAAKARKARAALLRKGARPTDVLQSVMKSLRGKSLVDDLTALETHNAAVDRRLRDRDTLLRPMVGGAPGGNAGVSAAVVAALDAERIIDLLVAPWDHVDAAMLPEEVPAPLAGREGKFLRALHRELTDRLQALAADPNIVLPALAQTSVRPWSPVIRCSSWLIEWCRRAEKARGAGAVGDLGSIKKELYELRATAYVRASELNFCAVRRLRLVGGSALEELADQIKDVRASLANGERQMVRSTWHSLGEKATGIRGVLESLDVSRASDSSSADGLKPGSALTDLLRTRIGVGMSPEDACNVLDAIDTALLPHHRCAPTGSLDRIRYLTISGSAGTPLATTFGWPNVPGGNVGSGSVLTFESLRKMPREPTSGDAAEFDASRADPGSKLAGNQMHNFAAFLYRSWRANDWMWGQADAAATLVDLVLDPARLAELSAEARRGLAGNLREWSTSPVLNLGEGTDGWSDSVVAQAEALWTAEVTEKVQAELVNLTPLSPVPELTRALLLWRRHAEIVAVELSREAADNPAGRAHPPTLNEAMKEWDEAPRRLGDKWGERVPTALGMRAVFVGWRTLFARADCKLGALRTALAPLVAFVAAFALCRRRSSFAVSAFLLGCVLPRTHGNCAGRLAVAAAGASVAGWWLIQTRRVKVDAGGNATRSRLDCLRGGWAWMTILATGALLGGAFVLDAEWLSDYLPSAANAGAGAWTRMQPYLLPVGAAFAATWVTWYWAKWWWHMSVAVLHGAIVGFWVYVGAQSDLADRWGALGDVLAATGSFWWALLVMAVLTSLLVYNVDVARVDKES